MQNTDREMRSIASSKRRLAIAGLVVVALAAASAGLASQTAGWWDDGGAPVARPAIVEKVFDKPNLAEKVNLADARIVARDPTSDVSLIAVPQSDGGYCISVSLGVVSDLPVACADNALANQGNVFVSWTIKKPGMSPVWVVAGRATQPGAATVSGLGLTVPVSDDGFFFSVVPGARWNALSRAQGRISILNVDGKELLASCARLPYSPTDATFLESNAETSGAATDFTDPPC